MRPEVRAAVLSLYSDVQREIDQRRPLCVSSGKCCRFEEYGHRLFVTTIEIGTFLHQLGSELTAIEAKAPKSSLPVFSPEPGCPFQVDKLCSVHAIRPFGCRMFFCDATSTDWQNEQYEQFHARLKRLHETLSVPYFYVEWGKALSECRISPKNL